MAPEPGKPAFFNVKAKFFRTYNKGTNKEYTSIEEVPTSGPFSSREAAEKFAAGLSTQKQIAQVEIKEAE